MADNSSINGTRCMAASSGNDAFSCTLSRGQSIGLAFVAEAGAISLVSCLILFALILRNVNRYWKYFKGQNAQWSILREPADVYVLSLFVADLTQAVGSFMDVKWVHQDTIEVGTYCTAQGAIQQLGETVVALTTITISIHTFLAVWVRKGAHHSRWIAFLVVGLNWLFVVLWVAIGGATHPNYFNPTPYWCWVGGKYMGERIAGEYLWLWAALITAVVVYLPLFLWNQGWIEVDEERWWRVRLPQRASTSPEFGNSRGPRLRRRPNAPSLALLAYPFAYSIIILPVSVVRWSSFSGKHIPDWATFFSVFIHDSFGAINVILLLLTKPNLLLFELPKDAEERGKAGARRGRGQVLTDDEDGDDEVRSSLGERPNEQSMKMDVRASMMSRTSTNSSGSHLGIGAGNSLAR